MSCMKAVIVNLAKTNRTGFEPSRTSRTGSEPSRRPLHSGGRGKVATAHRYLCNHREETLEGYPWIA
jgi:hypothetical protein